MLFRIRLDKFYSNQRRENTKMDDSNESKR